MSLPGVASPLSSFLAAPTLAVVIVSVCLALVLDPVAAAAEVLIGPRVRDQILAVLAALESTLSGYEPVHL